MDAPACLQILFLQQSVKPVGLAAKANNEDRSEIRMPGIAGDRALQNGRCLAVFGGGATNRMGEGNHAVDMRELGERLGPTELIGNQAGDGGRAIYGRKYANVIARGDRAIWTDDALESRCLRLREDDCRLAVETNRVISRAWTEFQIMGMDVLAGRDVARGGSDDLAIFEHSSSRRDWPDGGLVSPWNGVLCPHALVVQEIAWGEIAQGDDQWIDGCKTKRRGAVSSLAHGLSSLIIEKTW